MLSNFDYEPDNFPGQLPVGRLEEFEKAFTRWVEASRPIVLPSDYRQHIQQYHGGVPRKGSFVDGTGRRRTIGRFVNFLRPSDPLPPPNVVSWRGSGRDVRLDYSIDVLGPMSYANMDGLGPYLVPFACLDTNGHNCRRMARFDLLCFDFSDGGQINVVTWDCEKSSTDNPVTAPVIASFSELSLRVESSEPDAADVSANDMKF